MKSSAEATAVILALAAVGNLGPVRIKALLAQTDDPAEIPSWTADRLCQIPGIQQALAERIVGTLDVDYGRRLIDWADKHDINITTTADTGYPRMLRAMYDPPPFLFLAGSWSDADDKAVAIVGSRNASEYGKATAATLAAELARHGVTVVSGLAIGVDTASHRGALAAGGRTVAVLGSGIDVIYPPTNAALYHEITAHGVVCTEFFPGVEPNPGHFPRRNRIIAGLSRAIVVVEAGAKSGALLTADFALSQGKKLFAVPGNLSSRLSSGTNELIKAGAYLLTSADDIFTLLPELKDDREAVTPPAPADLTEGERIVLNRISAKPIQIDVIVRQSGLTVTDVSAFVLSLELRGLIRQLSGKRFITV